MRSAQGDRCLTGYSEVGMLVHSRDKEIPQIICLEMAAEEVFSVPTHKAMEKTDHWGVDVVYMAHVDVDVLGFL